MHRVDLTNCFLMEEIASTDNWYKKPLKIEEREDTYG